MNRDQSSLNPLSCAGLLVVLLTGCQPSDHENALAPNHDSVANSNAAGRAVTLIDACRLALVQHTGDAPLDKQIVQAQEAVRDGQTPAVALERLGWLFVAKARASFDDGF